MSGNVVNLGSKGSDRLQDFKFGGKDTADLRKSRQGKGIQLRKAKRNEQLMKRRDVRTTIVADSDASDDGSEDEEDDQTRNAEVARLVQMMRSAEVEVQLEGLAALREALSKDRRPPIQATIDNGAVPLIVQFLNATARPDVQYEAAWALTNIASGDAEHTCAVVDAGAVPLFIQLLGSSEARIQEQVVWALGNIAGDGPEYRDGLLELGVLPPLLRIITHPECGAAMLRTTTWVVSNLCRGKSPAPDWTLVAPCIPTMVLLAQQSDDPEVVRDACWSMSYLSDGDDVQIHAVMATGVCPRLVELMLAGDKAILVPTLRTLGNCLTGSELLTQAAIDSQCIPALLRLLAEPRLKESVRKEVCWAISNIGAGSQPQIQALIQAGAVRPMLHIMAYAEAKTRKEALWCISNMCAGGSTAQVQHIAEQGAITGTCASLTSADPKVCELAMQTLDHILDMGKQLEGENPCADNVEECGGLDALEQLQQSANERLYQQAYRLTVKYFPNDDGDAEELLAEDLLTETAPGAALFNF